MWILLIRESSAPSRKIEELPTLTIALPVVSPFIVLHLLAQMKIITKTAKTSIQDGKRKIW